MDATALRHIKGLFSAYKEKLFSPKQLLQCSILRWLSSV